MHQRAPRLSKRTAVHMSVWGSDVTDVVPTFLRFVPWWPKMRNKSVKEPKKRKLTNEKQK